MLNVIRFVILLPFYLIVFPFRFILFIFYKTYYFFLTQKAVYIKFPENFTFYEKSIWMNFFSDSEENYFHFLRNLYKIVNEKKISRVLIEIPNIENYKWNQIEDLFFILSKIKRSGKEIYAFLNEGGVKSLILASIANYRYTSDSNQFYIMLPDFEQIYWGKFLKKIGIQVEVYAAGEYKSAGEIFQRDRISEPAKKNMLELLKDFQTHIYDLFKSSESFTSNEFISLWDLFRNESIITAEKLFTKGYFHQLLDQVQFEEFVFDEKKPFLTKEVYHYFPGRGDEKSNTPHPEMSYRKSIMDFNDFLKMNKRTSYKLFPFFLKKHSVAMVILNGIIVNGSETDEANPDIINAKGYRKIFHELIESPYKAIFIYIDSPGGMSNASELLYTEIRKLSRVKPVYVMMGSVSASGGFYIACAGNKIISNKLTITGSIGVLRMRPNISGLYKKFDIQKTKLMKGRTTDIFSEDGILNKDSKKIMEESLRHAYKIFIQRVAKGRGLTEEEVKKHAEGKVSIAQKFEKVGLIDKNLSFVEFLDYYKEEAKLGSKEIFIIDLYPKVKFEFKKLLNLKNLITGNQNFELFTLLNEIIKNKSYYLSFELLKYYWNEKF